MYLLFFQSENSILHMNLCLPSTNVNEYLNVYDFDIRAPVEGNENYLAALFYGFTEMDSQILYFYKQRTCFYQLYGLPSYLHAFRIKSHITYRTAIQLRISTNFLTHMKITLCKDDSIQKRIGYI